MVHILLLYLAIFLFDNSDSSQLPSNPHRHHHHQSEPSPSYQNDRQKRQRAERRVKSALEDCVENLIDVYGSATKDDFIFDVDFDHIERQGGGIENAIESTKEHLQELESLYRSYPEIRACYVKEFHNGSGRHYYLDDTIDMLKHSLQELEDYRNDNSKGLTAPHYLNKCQEALLVSAVFLMGFNVVEHKQKYHLKIDWSMIKKMGTAFGEIRRLYYGEQTTSMPDKVAYELDTSGIRKMGGALREMIHKLRKTKYVKLKDEEFEEEIRKVRSDLKNIQDDVSYKASIVGIEIGKPVRNH